MGRSSRLVPDPKEQTALRRPLLSLGADGSCQRRTGSELSAHWGETASGERPAGLPSLRPTGRASRQARDWWWTATRRPPRPGSRRSMAPGPPCGRRTPIRRDGGEPGWCQPSTPSHSGKSVTAPAVSNRAERPGSVAQLSSWDDEERVERGSSPEKRHRIADSTGVAAGDTGGLGPASGRKGQILWRRRRSSSVKLWWSHTWRR